MSRATRSQRALLLLVGALVVMAGLIWGGGHRSRVDANAPAQSRPSVAPLATAIPEAPVVTAPARSAVARPTTVAGAAGMRIFKDPETGEIGPPTAGSSALEMDANSEDMTGLKQEVLPDGSVMVDLQGRFQESMVMRIDANGHSFMTCTRDVKKTLAHAPATSQTPQREER